MIFIYIAIININNNIIIIIIIFFFIFLLNDINVWFKYMILLFLIFFFFFDYIVEFISELFMVDAASLLLVFEFSFNLLFPGISSESGSKP